VTSNFGMWLFWYAVSLTLFFLGRWDGQRHSEKINDNMRNFINVFCDTFVASGAFTAEQKLMLLKEMERLAPPWMKKVFQEADRVANEVVKEMERNPKLRKKIDDKISKDGHL
jgi:hypothetical protein